MQVTIDLATTGVQYLQSLPYTIVGSGIAVEDFTNISSLSGQFVVGQDGTDSIVLDIAEDALVEGLESFAVLMFNGVSVLVDINDTTSADPQWDSWANWAGTGFATTLSTSTSAMIQATEVDPAPNWDAWSGNSYITTTQMSTSAVIEATEVDPAPNWDAWSGNSSVTVATTAETMIEVQ